MNRSVVSIALTATLLAAPAAFAAPSKADRSFADTAARAGLAEVSEAQIALQKSQRQDVRDFAQHMIDDHGKANDQLKEAAAAEQITLPTSPSNKDQQQAKKLQGLSGAAFDKQYIEDQRAAHREAVSLFTKESKSGSDPRLKQFAATTLPTLENHYQSIRSMSLTAKK